MNCGLDGLCSMPHVAQRAFILRRFWQLSADVGQVPSCFVKSVLPPQHPCRPPPGSSARAEGDAHCTSRDRPASDKGRCNSTSGMRVAAAPRAIGLCNVSTPLLPGLSASEDAHHRGRGRPSRRAAQHRPLLILSVGHRWAVRVPGPALVFAGVGANLPMRDGAEVGIIVAHPPNIEEGCSGYLFVPLRLSSRVDGPSLC